MVFQCLPVVMLHRPNAFWVVGVLWDESDGRMFMPDIQTPANMRLDQRYWIDSIPHNKSDPLPSFKYLFEKHVKDRGTVTLVLDECERFVKEVKSLVLSFNGFPVRCDLTDFFGDKALQKQVDAFTHPVGLIYFLRPR